MRTVAKLVPLAHRQLHFGVIVEALLDAGSELFGLVLAIEDGERLEQLDGRLRVVGVLGKLLGFVGDGLLFDLFPLGQRHHPVALTHRAAIQNLLASQRNHGHEDHDDPVPSFVLLQQGDAAAEFALRLVGCARFACHNKWCRCRYTRSAWSVLPTRVRGQQRKTGRSF